MIENHINKTQEKKVKEIKLLKPKIDIVFQSLFNQKNENITKSFAEALIGEKINSIVINDTKELSREYPEDKLGILDLELDINNKEKIDVEVQLLKNDAFINRLLFYWSKIYSKQIKRGNKYRNAKRVVIIAIVDFEINLTKELRKMESIWNLREKESPEKVLTDLIEIHIINLKRVKEEYLRDKDNIKNQWIMFLDDPNSEEVKEIMEKNEDVKKAVVTVRKMSEDEKMEKLAELRLKAIMDEEAIYDTGVNDGIEKGIKKGKNAKTVEIAKKLLNKNMSIEEIIDITGITKEEIEDIKNKK